MFEYCPNCAKKSISFYDNIKWKCSHCSFEYYHNIAGAVAVIIKKNDTILFTIRNNEPQRHKLDLPGGFIDEKESAEECCVRELNEELNISIEKKKLKYIGSAPNTYLYKDILYNTIDLFFLYDFHQEISSFNHEELQEIRWINTNEIPYKELAFQSQIMILKKYFQ